MVSYLIRRILLIVPTLIGMTLLVFFVMALSPGGAGADLARGEGMRPEERKALQKYLNERYGLDKPLFVQYGRWLNRVSPIGFRPNEDGSLNWRPTVKWPDLGHSFIVHRSVSDLMAERIPITLLLNTVSLPLVYITAVVLGLYAARKRGGTIDVGFGTVLLGLWSVPVIWSGIMLQGYFTSEEYFRWFPTVELHSVKADVMPFLPSASAAPELRQGWLLDMAWHLVLPIICLTYGQFAYLSKLARSAVLETMTADFVRTARAKGVDEKKVLYRHVLGNSLIPLITVGAQILPAMIAGSVVVETIFSINGMGKLLVDAVQQHDRELVLSTTLVSGALGLLGYLLADIGYAIADPRVSYE
jgi:ABC-type dipeptide/oligopeptide/nickel transport system permease component